MSRDIVHAQRGFRRRFCGDFVNRFSEGEALPMDWEEDMQLPTGNDIRFADEILPGGQDEIPAVGGDEIRSCGADGGREKFASRAPRNVMTMSHHRKTYHGVYCGLRRVFRLVFLVWGGEGAWATGVPRRRRQQRW